ncbi:HlyD family type I secretion periplasmic adaptor subunit [Primorskyibacter sp. S87]|uniref:HlyD family type I secretion periplasmic adaptor subunit n=1 Tax=Primorskyibacter sp. S87 TaxID=3415126 RepID=UPI003C7ABEC1
MFLMRGGDEEYVNRPGGKDAGAGLWALLLVILMLFFGVGFWAAIYEIEEVTRASGRVVPSSQLQSVQSAEGGIIAAIEVHEGDVVDAGQVLFEIDDTGAQSRLGELEQRQHSLGAQLTRLRAEAAGAEEIVFPHNSEIQPRLIEAETAVFQTRKKQLELELEVLNQRQMQKQAELAELSAKQNRMEAVAEPLRRELEIMKELFQQGTSPEIAVLRLQSKLAETEGDLAIAHATKDRLRAGIEEIDAQIVSARSSYGLTAREGISKALAELSVVEESLTAARDRVSRMELRSPALGTVNRVNLTNVGSVVQPGMVLAEIVPLDDSLLIEAQVRPRDVAFVRVGAEASVKITAFDYLRYGDLPAVVERIGADALQDGEGTPYFQVMLRTEQSALGSDDNAFQISPGMIASVDIQSGQKTVLEYLIQPVLRAQHEALRER